MAGLVVTLSLSLLAASTPAPPAPAKIERWYEVDLVASGDTLAPSSGLTLATLAEELAADAFDGAILWLPPIKGSKLPHEPIARRLDGEEGVEPLFAAALAALREHKLAVAVGLADPVEAGAAAGAATVRAVRLDGATGASDLLRLARPSLRELYWCDPAFAAQRIERSQAVAFVLSERQVAALQPELRATQARLDLLAFGAPPAGARAGLDEGRFARVVAQSQLASRVATELAGSTPERLDPFHNVWFGAAPPELPRALRRAPPWLDLEESLLSPGAFDVRADAAEPSTPPSTNGNGGAPSGDPPPAAAAEAAVPGLLSASELSGFRSLFALRRAAVRALGRHLLVDDAAARDEVESKLAQCESLVDTLGAFGAEWQHGLADDRALCKVLEAWRVATTNWKVALAGRAGPELELAAHFVDDERARGFAEPAAESIGGERLPLSRHFELDPERRIVLRSELALIDPRAARLEISGGGRFTVLVNGAEQVSRFDAVAEPLLSTLPLAAGRNVVELQLAPDPDASDPRVHLALLPHHIEGITLEPKRALRTAEPVVRLHDPGALAEESLVWPPGRTVGSSESGSADFPFEPTWSGRTDVWIHALLGVNTPGRLSVAIDEGPQQMLEIPLSSRWQWLRLPAPLAATSGPHRLVLTFRTPGTRVDAVTLFESGLSFPHPPAGDGSLADAAWRFDPLGAGLVIDLPPLAQGDLFGRSFQVEKSANFQVYVWLRGRDPLPFGETAELDLTSATTRMRFVVPAGTPYEEWVAVGSVNLTTDERVELRARGRGALSRVALLR